VNKTEVEGTAKPMVAFLIAAQPIFLVQVPPATFVRVRRKTFWMALLHKVADVFPPEKLYAKGLYQTPALLINVL
jgi:hypothetical protein